MWFIYIDFILIIFDAFNVLYLEKLSLEIVLRRVNVFLYFVLWCKYIMGKKNVLWLNKYVEIE